ncbi:uncharacterized protein LOC142325731 [Lycorma delicatula]|uniref:uncharacterized protein LOC142325731 n=1 Tax=Lycorma delicatula TaxID=130591 RepID=UPI003F510A40
MYRQIRIDPGDYNLQRILWRKSSNEPVREYRLTTVTNGTASAPFLSTRCLRQLAFEEADKYPQAAKILQRDFYIDDWISGAEDLHQAISLQRDLQALLESGGFQIRKLSTNSSKLLENIPPEFRETPHSLNFLIVATP